MTKREWIGIGFLVAIIATGYSLRSCGAAKDTRDSSWLDNVAYGPSPTIDKAAQDAENARLQKILSERSAQEQSNTDQPVSKSPRPEPWALKTDAASSETPRDVLGHNVLTIARHCSNSESEILEMVDGSIEHIAKWTGKRMTRSEIVFQALAVIDSAKKDKKYPRNKDGKFEFGAIAGGISIAAVENSRR